MIRWIFRCAFPQLELGTEGQSVFNLLAFLLLVSCLLPALPLGQKSLVCLGPTLYFTNLIFTAVLAEIATRYVALGALAVVFSMAVLIASLLRRSPLWNALRETPQSSTHTALQ